jgi:hypothetical protein
MANTTRRASGRRLTAEMLNALLSASWAASVPTAPSGSAFSPRRKNSTRLIPSAGPAVQIMFLMCWPVVRPRPTSCGTRMVVSDSGVILSPKYAPRMTAPAAVASDRPITLAMPTNGTQACPRSSTSCR